MPGNKKGDKVPRTGLTRAAKDGGFVLPRATRKDFKPKVQRQDHAVYCGAKRKRKKEGQREPSKCKMRAGWGTNHPGIGKCKLHGGSAPGHVKAAAKAEYRKLLGVPLEINPLDALLWCIKIRAGEIKWLSERMHELDNKHWIEDTMVGKQFHLYARERQRAMSDLARYSQMAISLGIAERAVKLAETYGDMLAAYTQGLLNDLWPHLDEEGRAKAPQVVRRHLLLLDGAKEESKQLPTAA